MSQNQPKPPPREGQLGFVVAPPLRIQGISVAGEQSVIHVPEFDVAFDIGLCPRATLSANVVALSHTHMDHVAGLPYWFSQRYFQHQRMGTCLCHPEMLAPLTAMMRTWVDLERQRTPHEFVPVAPGQEYRVRPNVYIRAIGVDHTVPSLGFVLLERRNKLRPEFEGLPQERLRQLRVAGTEITHTIDIPLVAYTGDTAPGDFLLCEDFVRAKVVVTECTFFDPTHRDRARVGKHIHVDELPPFLRAWQAEHVVVVHVSRRTMIPFARESLEALDGGAHAGRLHLLMDHKTNRMRQERLTATAPEAGDDATDTSSAGDR